MPVTYFFIYIIIIIIECHYTILLSDNNNMFVGRFSSRVLLKSIHRTRYIIFNYFSLEINNHIVLFLLSLLTYASRVIKIIGMQLICSAVTIIIIVKKLLFTIVDFTIIFFYFSKQTIQFIYFNTLPILLHY